MKSITFFVLTLLIFVTTVLLQSCGVAYAKKRKRGKRPGLGMVGLCKTKVCTFTMGGDVKSGSPGTRDVQLQSYKIDRTSVTNQMFRMYVKETKYKTESEHFGWSFVFDPLVSKTVRQNNPRTLEKGGQHWRAIESAYWRQPEGVDSNLKERWDYPAVHISKNDAEQYCEYYGLRLPTEAEWEYAARGTFLWVESPTFYYLLFHVLFSKTTQIY